jgi:hypothetical protein
MLVGDITEYLARAARAMSPTATMLDQNNYQKIEDGVYYISLGDFTDIAEFNQALSRADTLIYCPPQGKWSDNSTDRFSMESNTKFHLKYWYNSKNVVGITLDSSDKYLGLSDVRRSKHTAQLWVAGCSVSHGIGLKDESDRYGVKLSAMLDLPVSFLTRSGSSIQWQADQILRSDIKDNDIVVWGVTGWNRFVYYRLDSVSHVNISYYQRHPEFNQLIDVTSLSDQDNLIYQSITAIVQVVNFCQKVGAKLILAGVLTDDLIIDYLLPFKNFIPLFGAKGFSVPEGFVDAGHDNIHPGVKSHQWYAEQIYARIKE